MSELNVIPFLNVSNNTPLLTRFIHESIDDLLGKLTLAHSNFSNEIEWTEDEFNNAKHDIQKFYCNNILQETTPGNIKDMTNEVNQIIQDCFKVRQKEIKLQLIKEGIVKAGHNLVENFDWRLKWIMGSSKLASIREPVLQLDFNNIRNNPDTNETERNVVNCEMNLEQLDNLIKELSDAQMTLVNLS